MGKYLITGGAGFIGSHIVRSLVERGDRVRILDNLSGGSMENLAGLDLGHIGGSSAVEFLRGDVTDPITCNEVCKGIDGLFHEAAEVSVPASFAHPDRHLDVNVMGTVRILEGARRAGVKRVIFAASSAAYGDSEESPKHEGLDPNPLSPYAAAKRTGEDLLSIWGRQYGIDTVSLRYFNVFGPRQSDTSPYSGVIAIFAKCLLSGNPITIHGDGEQTRDFVFVEDVARANLCALDANVPSGRVINIGTGVKVSLNELYQTMAGLCGSDAKPDHGEARSGDVRSSCADISRAKQELGWRPQVSLQDGLARTIEWYREQPFGPG
ncbi:MAG: nucleoside-diphosphate-sugar epimerase [Planctomycetota bacterium]|jgi:nucleoside-diphosphate-sugar epimerase